MRYPTERGPVNPKTAQTIATIEAENSHREVPERRTYIRRYADAFSAGVLRGEVSPPEGEWVEVPEND